MSPFYTRVLDIGLRPGDIFVVWGRSPLSYLIYAVFGFRDPATHAELVYDGGIYNISSAVGGVRFRPTSHMYSYRKWIILRNKTLDHLPWSIIQESMEKYIGRPYDYALYLIWIARISLILQPLVWLIMQPFRNFLKKRESYSFTCSEYVVQVCKDLSVDTGIDEPHNAPPDHLLQAARACPHNWEVIASGGKLKRRKTNEIL